MDKKILFFTTPAFGHINSTLPIIEKLINDGYKIYCYSNKEYKKAIEGIGAIFIEYKIKFNINDIEKYTSNFVELLKALTDLNHKAYELYIDEIDYSDVDLVLYDSMCSFAKNIAYKKKKKSVCIETTFAYNLLVFLFSNMFWKSLKTFIRFRKDLIFNIKEEKKFRKIYKLPKLKVVDLFVNSGDKTIVLTPKEIQPFAKTFNKNFYFVGTTIKERLNKQNEEYKKRYRYFISLGSIYKLKVEDLKEILKNNDLKDSKIAVIFNKDINIENVDIYKFVDQISFLKHVDIFINHGGLNSVYEAIYLNVKQISIPMQEEQRLTALICKHKKIGGYAKDYKKLNKEIKYVNKYNKNLSKYSKIMQSYDGTNLACKIIDIYINEGI